MPLSPTRPLLIITMDMASLLQKTPCENKYILEICDQFTKYTKTYAMKGQTAEEVSEKYVDFCLNYGIPEAVLIDRGTNFTCQVIESLWEWLDFHTLRTTAFHP